jgi:hypothetical protein
LIPARAEASTHSLGNGGSSPAGAAIAHLAGLIAVEAGSVVVLAAAPALLHALAPACPRGRSSASW